jgi:hypothetical protein
LYLLFFLTFIEKTTRAEWRKKTKNRERKERKNGGCKRSPTGKEKKRLTEKKGTNKLWTKTMDEKG